MSGWEAPPGRGCALVAAVGLVLVFLILAGVVGWAIGQVMDYWAPLPWA